MIFTMLNGHGKKRKPFHKWLLKNVTETTCGLQSLQYLLSVSYRKGLTNLETESVNHELKSGERGMKDRRNEGKGLCLLNWVSVGDEHTLPLQPISPLNCLHFILYMFLLLDFFHCHIYLLICLLPLPGSDLFK